MSSSSESVRAAYDIASEAYARKFVNELDHKPLDRESLDVRVRAPNDTEHPSTRGYVFARKLEEMT